jgi:DNA-binding winged helix-turn-helix (wHTH) protein
VEVAFGDHMLDVDRRELRRGAELIALEPQVFDLLVYLVHNRDHVVSMDDLLAAVWGGRIVSESTLRSRINAVRKAVGDSGEAQRLIRTVPRKGIRFVGAVRETGVERRLAAILAADVAGYSRLMGRDEEGTMRHPAGAPRDYRCADRSARRAHRLDCRRRAARRVRQPASGVACGFGAAAGAGDGERRAARSKSDAIPRRHQSGRRDGRG